MELVKEYIESIYTQYELVAKLLHHRPNDESLKQILSNLVDEMGVCQLYVRLKLPELACVIEDLDPKFKGKLIGFGLPDEVIFAGTVADE